MHHEQVASLLKVLNKSFLYTIRKAHEAKTGTDLKVALYQTSLCGNSALANIWIDPSLFHEVQGIRKIEESLFSNARLWQYFRSH